MFWNKKKKEDKGLPDLPVIPRAAPSMKDFHKAKPVAEKKEEEEIHGLPSFPDSPMKKGFSQTAIKDAIETPDIQENEEPDEILKRKEPEELPQLHGMQDVHEEVEEEEEMEEMTSIPIPQKRARLVEMEEWKPSQPPRESSLPRTLPSTRPIQHTKKNKENKPVFIRLDKFQDAKDSLSTVEEKLGDIDELLKTIREVKAKEDRELIEWEKDIEGVKARLKSINIEIFETGYES